MKPFHFHPEALAEATDAVLFYEERQAGLGKRFLNSLTDSINRIRRNPNLYRKVNSQARKCRLLRFPYGIIFRNKEEYVEIVAVMHLRRRPGYWKTRS